MCRECETQEDGSDVIRIFMEEGGQRVEEIRSRGKQFQMSLNSTALPVAFEPAFLFTLSRVGMVLRFHILGSLAILLGMTVVFYGNPLAGS